MPQDPDNHAKKRKLKRVRFVEDFTEAEKVSEMSDIAEKAIRRALHEKCFVKLTPLDGIEGKNCIKQEKADLWFPETEILGTQKHFYKRLLGPEEETVEKGSRPGVPNVAEKTFDFNSRKTKVGSHTANFGFSERCLGSWEKGVRSTSPVVSDEEDSRGEIFSIPCHSHKEQSADKTGKRASDNDYVSEKGQYKRLITFPVKHDRKKGLEQEAVVSEENFSWGLDVKKRNCKEETCSESESLSKPLPSERESIKAHVTIKECSVLLEDIYKRKEKPQYCLKPPNAKKPPPKLPEDKAIFWKKLKVVLHDMLENSSLKNSGNPFPVKNAERPPENIKVDEVEVERDLDLNRPAQNSGRSGAVGINIAKPGTQLSSLEISALCDQGVFARFSIIDADHENSAVSHIEENEKVTESRQGDSFLISGSPSLKTTSSKPTELFMEYENESVKEVHGEDTCHTAEEYPETHSPTFSEVADVEDVDQPSGINLSSVFSDRTFHMYKMDSETGHEDILQGNCEFEPRVVLLHLGDPLKLDLDENSSSKTETETFTDGRIAPDCNALDGEVSKEQVDVEEKETVNQSDSVSMSRNPDSCLFLLDLDGVLDDHVPEYAAENNSDLEYEYINFDRGCDSPPLEDTSTSLSPADDTAVMTNEVGCDGDIDSGEGNANFQPDKEKSPVGVCL